MTKLLLEISPEHRARLDRFGPTKGACFRPITQTNKSHGMETKPATEGTSPPGVIGNFTIPDRNQAFWNTSLVLSGVFTLHACLVL